MDLFRLKPESARPGFDTATRIITTGAAYAAPVLFDDQFSPSGITGFPVTLSTGDIPTSTGEGVYAGTSTAIGDGQQASHWKDDALITRKIGIMDPTASNGSTTPAIVNNLRAIDQRIMGLIGWNVSSSGSVLSDNGILRINGTTAANSISSAVSTNSTGGKTFTSAISSGSTTVVGYFDNATLSGVTYDGKGGDDNISGSSRSETISGGTGNDTINGGDGNDSINGDDGADVLFGGIGNDSLQGGLGNDSISGDDGDDSLRGDAGVDSLSAAAGNDKIDAADGIVDLVLKGGTGNDSAY